MLCTHSADAVDSYYEVLDGETETWDIVSGKVALVVRSQVDCADRIVTKSTTDPMIEGMVQTILDPFNAYQQPDQGGEGHIFSILQPLSMSSSTLHTSPGHPISSFARTRTSTVTQLPTLNGVNSTSESAQPNVDDDSTPKRRHGKDKLSWISERSGTKSDGDAIRPESDLPADAADDAVSTHSDSTRSDASSHRHSPRHDASIPGLDHDTARWQ